MDQSPPTVEALLDLATPLAVVDRARLQHNVTAMAAHVRSLGIALRPHVKTHKSPKIAHLQVVAGAAGLTVATLGEALVFAEAGFTDLFLAYPTWLDRPHRRLLDRLLATGAQVSIGCDNPTSAARLAPYAGRVDVLVEVDSGHHRSGVAPHEIGPIVESLVDQGLDVRGAFTFPGHAYAPDGRAAAAEQEAAALREAGHVLRQYVADPVLSGGSTPSIGHLEAGAATETRPGVYVFGDAQQWELGSVRPDDIAYTVHATVVSAHGGRVVLDAGSKVLGADRAAWATGYARLLDHPEARLSQLSEHHAVVDWPDAGPPRVGTRLRVVPNHVCNSVNLVDELVVLDEEGGIQTWPVSARGRNS